MQHIKAVAVLVVTSTCFTLAQAQSLYPLSTHYYAEVGLLATDIKDNGPTYNPNSMRLLVGKPLDRNLAIEGMYAFTVNSENQPGVDAKSSYYGIGLKPQMGLSDNTDLFARIGYARSYVTGSPAGEKTLSDWMYSIGVQTKFTQDIYGQLDYTTYLHREGVSANAVGFSVGMRFY